MSKKSRKNPSKPATSKVAKRASVPAAKTAAKTTAKAETKAATKGPTKKAAVKAVKPPAKMVVKAAAKPAPKAGKVPKAAVAKAPAAVKTAPKRVANAATKPTPKPPAAPKPAVASKPAAASKPAPDQTAARAPAVAAEGAKAPAFQLPRDGGATVSLSDYAGQKLVIFFYPRASTPGCTREAMDFTRLSREFEAAGTAVLGVSADSQKAQESFRDKYSLSVPLLSDTTQAMLKTYGAWGEKSMYGKIFEGVLRTTVLISADGVVAKIWRSVKVDGHADAVLEEANRI